MKSPPAASSLPAIRTAALLAGLCPAALIAQGQFQEGTILQSPNIHSGGLFGSGGVARIPDVNADGFDDFAVGASSERPPGSPSNAGRVHVYNGKTLEVWRELRDPNETTNGYFGGSISGVGDLNGNGTGEILIGAANPNRVLVMDGGTGDVIHTFFTPVRRTSSMDDVSGDGIPDLLIGATGSGGAPGFVRIYDGTSGTLLDTIVSPDNNVANNFFGHGVAGVPDLNGDGHGDLVVGDWRFQSDTGRAYVFDGVSRALLYTVPAPAGSPGQFARSVVGLTDVNNDGKGDFIVGTGNGAAYIFSGSDGSIHHQLIPNRPTASFGWSVGAVPDTTGDGIMDVVVGSFIVFPGDIEVFNGATGEYLASMNPHLDSGGDNTLTGIGDVNGDGLGEVLMGSPYHISTTGIDGAGQVRVFLSSPPPQLRPVGFSGTAFQMHLFGEAGLVVEVHGTENGQDWSLVGRTRLGAGPRLFEDTTAASHPTRLYKVRRLPPR